MSLHIVPVELREANAFVDAMHRHHSAVQGHRFSLGCCDESGLLHGVAIVGRPVARLSGPPRDVLEVTRLATDGTANACSMLYAAAARAAKAMGYRRIQTYTLHSEQGASLRAAGWVRESSVRGRQWNHTDGRARKIVEAVDKWRWGMSFARPELTLVMPEEMTA